VTIHIAMIWPSSARAWVLDAKGELDSAFDFLHALGGKLYDQGANSILGYRLDIVEIDGASLGQAVLLRRQQYLSWYVAHSSSKRGYRHIGEIRQR
jgi:hypothetical protein